MLTDSRGEWTADVDREYRAWRKRLQLFAGDHEAYFVDGESGQKQLYPYRKVNWLGDRLSKRIAELVFPGFPRLFATGKPQQELVAQTVRELRVPQVTYPTALMVSWGGWAPWKVYWSEQAGGPALTLWGVQPGEFCYFDYRAGDRARPYAANCWYETEIERQGKPRKCKVCERYEVGADRKVTFSNRAWLVEGSLMEGGGGKLKEIGLAEALPEGSAVPPEKGAWPTSELPVWSIPNVDLFGAGTGDSDYSESLVDIQKQVNAVYAQRALVVALTGLPHFTVPRRLLGPDGSLDLRNIWIQVEYEGEEPTPITITNWDGNLQQTAQQLEELNKAFMHCSILSPAVDGQVAGVGGESGYARRLSMVKLEAGVWRRRANYEPAFEWLIRTSQELRRARGVGGRTRPEVDLEILWSPPIPEDPEGASRSIESLIRVGAMSIEAGVRRANPTESDAWIKGEVARIKEDQVLLARAARMRDMDPATVPGAEGKPEGA